MPRQPTLADVNTARARLRGVALHTPLESSPALAAEVGAVEVRLKREELQPTGAFKIRGAHNKVAAIAESRPEAALVTASTGNHGIAVAAAAARHDMRLTVLVGRNVTPAKLERLRAFETGRCTVELAGNDPLEAEAESRRRDDAGHAIYISPYNDVEVVAGQATVGVEIVEDWPDVDAVVVPVGGGGLIGGTGLWIKAVKPSVRVIGVQPAGSPPLYSYFETGSTEPMPIAPTIADAVAGNIEHGSITWKLVRDVADEIVLVDEEPIRDAMRWAMEEQRVLLEPSGALGIAALRTWSSASMSSLDGLRVAVVCSGRNVSPDLLRSLFA